MARGEQLSRQWRIIQLLNSSRKGRTIAELSDELDCHERTVYRDIDALSQAGFPLFNEKNQEGINSWRILDGFGSSPSIPMTLTEAMALFFGRDMLKSLRGTVFHDAIGNVFEKIMASMPEETRAYLKKLERHVHFGQRPYKKFVHFKELIQALQAAIDQRTSVDILYHTMSRGRDMRRRVDPYDIWFSDGAFYMIGYCHARKAVRLFALDRIRIHHVTEEHFEIPRDFSAAHMMESSFGVFQGPKTLVRIHFDSTVAGYVREKIWHDSQKIIDRPDGSILFQARVAGIEEIFFWVMRWGSHARVLSPPALCEKMRSEIEAMQNAYLKPAMNRKEKQEQLLLFAS